MWFECPDNGFSMKQIHQIRSQTFIRFDGNREIAMTAARLNIKTTNLVRNPRLFLGHGLDRRNITYVLEITRCGFLYRWRGTVQLNLRPTPTGLCCKHGNTAKWGDITLVQFQPLSTENERFTHSFAVFFRIPQILHFIHGSGILKHDFGKFVLLTGTEPIQLFVFLYLDI
jgi:hypothetical protein